MWLYELEVVSRRLTGEFMLCIGNCTNTISILVISCINVIQCNILSASKKTNLLSITFVAIAK